PERAETISSTPPLPPSRSLAVTTELCLERGNRHITPRSLPDHVWLNHPHRLIRRSGKTDRPAAKPSRSESALRICDTVVTIRLLGSVRIDAPVEVGWMRLAWLEDIQLWSEAVLDAR